MVRTMAKDLSLYWVNLPPDIISTISIDANMLSKLTVFPNAFSVSYKGYVRSAT
jgi:hypothetical protein